MSHLDYKKFREILAELRSSLPTAYPVVVRRTTLKKSWGDCDLIGKRKKKFLIRIHKGLDRCATISILIHEYSHALSWTFEHQDLHDHGPLWAVNYGRVYQEVMEP